ncbi:hypothetical protein BG011_002245, partial [Mortierella polycephala]
MGDKQEYNNIIFREFIKGVSKVVCLDADLTNQDVQLVKSLRDDVQVIHNTFKPQEGDQVLLYETEGLLTNKVVDLLQEGKCVWISSTQSAENTEALHMLLKGLGFRGECVTKNRPESEKQDIATNINTIMADLDYFIHTPTITVGLDYNVQGRVDCVVGLFSTHSKVNVETCRQMMRRVRHVTSNTYHVHVDRATNNLPVTVEAINSWLLSNGAALMRKGMSGLRLGVQFGSKPSLPEGFYSRLWTSMRIKKHQSLNGFMKRFSQQMLAAGCSIRGVAVAKEIDVDPILEALQDNRKAVREQHCQQISSAKNLAHEDFERLQVRSDTTLPERHAMSKFLLMEAYNITHSSIVTPKWVNTYDNDCEKRFDKNLRALQMSGGTIQESLEFVYQREQILLCEYIASGNETRAQHKLASSQYLQLKIAAELLTACGFTDVFSKEKTSSEALKNKVDTHWETLKDEMENM